MCPDEARPTFSRTMREIRKNGRGSGEGIADGRQPR